MEGWRSCTRRDSDENSSAVKAKGWEGIYHERFKLETRERQGLNLIQVFSFCSWEKMKKKVTSALGSFFFCVLLFFTFLIGFTVMKGPSLRYSFHFTSVLSGHICLFCLRQIVFPFLSLFFFFPSFFKTCHAIYADADLSRCRYPPIQLHQVAPRKYKFALALYCRWLIYRSPSLFICSVLCYLQHRF